MFAKSPFASAKTADMVRLLVDHLDKVLETGERLGGVRFAARPITSAMSADDILAEHARQREFLDGLRALEMTLCARIDKARAWAREMRGLHGNLKLMASLFLTGTQGLADAMEDVASTAPRHNISTVAETGPPLPENPPRCCAAATSLHARRGPGSSSVPRPIASPAASSSARCWICARPSSRRSTSTITCSSRAPRRRPWQPSRPLPCSAQLH